MAQNSVVVDELIAKSVSYIGSDGLVTSDHFIMAFLDVVKSINSNSYDFSAKDKAKFMREIEAGKIVFELKAQKLGKENLHKAVTIFSDTSLAFASLKAYGYGSEEKRSRIELSKIMAMADEENKKDNFDEIKLSAVLKIILEHPSAAIKTVFKFLYDANATSSESAPSGIIPDDGVNVSGGSSNNSGLPILGEETGNKPPELSDDAVDSLNRILNKNSGADSSSSDNAPGNVKLSELVKKSKDVHEKLLQTVFGQDHAVSTFVSGYFQAETLSIINSKSKKPKAVFLFAGPPGVGKTFLAEQSAKALGKPFRRFDMSEYSDKEANIEFCGISKSYKAAEPGTVTSFVAENPNAVLLFDEIEKAHLNVIHLFLQILDAGRIRDNYTDEEVSFKDTIIIFTTNAGKQLYEDESIPTLSAVPQKSILNALLTDINPATNAPFFPRAIGSRFASGNIVMFNNLKTNHLINIIEHEFEKQVDSFAKKVGYEITVDKNVAYSLMYAEGGRADARTITGKSSNFIFKEIHELLRLVQSKKPDLDLTKLKNIKVTVELPKDEKIKELFSTDVNSDILVFAKEASWADYEKCGDKFNFSFADNFIDALKALQEKSPSFILCEVGDFISADEVLNVEDIDNECRDFIEYLNENVSIPYYIVEKSEGELVSEEKMTYLQNGAHGIISKKGKGGSLKDRFAGIALEIAQQKHLFNLARANKVVAFKTKQNILKGGTSAVIKLFDHRMKRAVDAEDSKNIFNSSVYNIKFEDVIGASDAKSELQYFIEYLKDPVKFVQNGVKAPKGVLLYGPPGTGKTLLAKAMSGESDVTFISAEGNQFLKSYVGEGADAVHEVFRVARKYAPSILFIDEIDAVGKNRNSSNGDSSSSALTALLTEMDGFKVTADRPVFVLAATNYKVNQDGDRSLDPALLRRFDRKILVDLPSKEDRIKFIKQKQAKSKNIDISEAQIENLADRSTGMSLADLDAVFEYAIRNSIKSENFKVDDACLEDAFEGYNSGEKKMWDKDLLRRVAIHEAGHALVCWLTGETPTYLTIVARGDHGGYMQHSSNEGKALFTKKELLNRVKVSLGGRAAEIAVYGKDEGLSTGASGDFDSATSVVENIICYYGMDEEVGIGVIRRDERSSNSYAPVRQRVNAILAEELKITVELLTAYKDALNKLVDELLLKNNLKGEDIDRILSKAIDRKKINL